MPSNDQSRLERLALETLQVDSRDGTSPEPSRMCDSARVTGIGLVSSDPKKLAKLPSLIEFNRIAEVAQFAREIHPRSSLQAHSGMSSAAEAREFAMNALHRARAAAFVKYLTGII